MKDPEENEKKYREMNDTQFTFIDLFADIGGMRLAFDRVGGRYVYSSK